MRFTLINGTPPSTTQIDLGDSPDPLPFGDLSVDGESNVQITDLFRADYSAIFDRGNKKIVVSFKTWHFHATRHDAVMFIWDHPDEALQNGVLEITIDRSGTRSKRWMEGAVVQTAKLTEDQGCTTLWTYQIQGTKVLKENPLLAQ